MFSSSVCVCHGCHIIVWSLVLTCHSLYCFADTNSRAEDGECECIEMIATAWSRAGQLRILRLARHRQPAGAGLRAAHCSQAGPPHGKFHKRKNEMQQKKKSEKSFFCFFLEIIKFRLLIDFEKQMVLLIF